MAYSRTFEIGVLRRGDEQDCDVEVEVEFEVESWGSPASALFGLPEDYDPGEGGEIVIVGATRLDTSADVLDQLSEKERERIETEILENLDEYADDGPDYEPDYD